jgi:hypothetical protein
MQRNNLDVDVLKTIQILFKNEYSRKKISLENFDPNKYLGILTLTAIVAGWL